jgi:uncharacterized protein YciI
MTVRYDVHPVTPQARYLEKAAETLSSGGLGLCPTDAGYVLVWSLNGREAEERVRRLRQLDSKHSFTLLCRQLSEAGRLNLAGPFPAIDAEDPGPAGFSGSLIVAEFPSLAEAKAWAELDPYLAAGVYAGVDVRPLRLVLP